MKVGEIMTRGVEIASPDDTIQQAASRMAELDVDVLPMARTTASSACSRTGTSRSVPWPRAGDRTPKCAR